MRMPRALGRTYFSPDNIEHSVGGRLLTCSLIHNFLQTLARYNAFANRRLYEACTKLPDAGRKKQRSASFGSIHGTLNHIMVGDHIWLARFAGEEVTSTNLDATLYEDFDELRRARVSEDERIETFTSGLNEEFLGVRPGTPTTKQ